MFQEFYRPVTTAEAVTLRKQYASSVYVAGGTEVNSKGWCARTKGAALVDRAIGLARLPLGTVENTPGGLSIGATVPIQALIENPVIPPLLSAAARQFANRNIRTMATIGGNIGANKSCSNLIPSLLALDATLQVAAESGESVIPLSRYIDSPDPRALIISIHVVSPNTGRFWATRKHSRTVNDISIISVAVTFDGSAAKIDKPIIAVGGVAAHVIRLCDLEKQLDGKALPSREDIASMAAPLMSPIDDLRGSGPYKRHIAAVFIGWALHNALLSKGGKA